MKSVIGSFKINADDFDREAGVFCDIDGTLMQGFFLNRALADYLVALVAAGVEVTLFSNGDSECMTTMMRDEGLDEILLPVRRKRAFKGGRLDVMIDDQSPESQGIVADLYIHPREFEDGIPAALREKWDVTLPTAPEAPGTTDAGPDTKPDATPSTQPKPRP